METMEQLNRDEQPSEQPNLLAALQVRLNERTCPEKETLNPAVLTETNDQENERL